MIIPTKALGRSSGRNAIKISPAAVANTLKKLEADGYTKFVYVRYPDEIVKVAEI